MSQHARMLRDPDRHPTSRESPAVVALSLPGAAASILHVIGRHELAREAATRACSSPSREYPRCRRRRASLPATAASIMYAVGLIFVIDGKSWAELGSDSFVDVGC
jgi:hypothetical protein